jgi:hypothetical protein
LRGRRRPSAWELACHASLTTVFAAQRLFALSASAPLQTVSNRTIGYATGTLTMASSSRSQRAMRSNTTLTLSDLPRTIRRRPLASAGICCGCYSASVSTPLTRAPGRASRDLPGRPSPPGQGRPTWGQGSTPSRSASSRSSGRGRDPESWISSRATARAARCVRVMPASLRPSTCTGTCIPERWTATLTDSMRRPGKVMRPKCGQTRTLAKPIRRSQVAELGK